MPGRADEMSPRRRALVTDVQLRSALAGVRGLGVAGIDVVALAPRRSAAGMWSRYATAREVTADVRDDPAAFVRDVVAAAGREAPCVVYPGREQAIDALLDARLPDGVTLPFGGPETLSLRDKRVLSQAAPAAGFAPQPGERVVTAAELRGAGVSPPVVVKAALPGTAPAAAAVVLSREELDLLLAPLPDDQVLLLQEVIAGPLIVLAVVLRRDGTLAAQFQQQTLSTWPASGGTTRRARSVAIDPGLVDSAVTLLRRAGFWGLAQLDVINGPDGPVLLDVNPRFYDSMPLALACGVNLPAQWHAAALDAPSPGPAPYRVGTEFRWLEADVIAALRREAAPAAGTTGATVGAVWNRADPVPAAIAAAEAGVVRFARLLPGRITAPGRRRRPA